jgi:3-hydroxyacyl-[acyl-carrier-protein] dehydratase
VALSEDHFVDHFPGMPVMPGSLIIEAMAQAATVLIEWSSGLSQKAVLVMVKDLKFRSFVSPGDQLLIEEDVVAVHDGLVELTCVARVNASVVAGGTLVMSSQEATNIHGPAALAMRDMIYETWLRTTRIDT